MNTEELVYALRTLSVDLEYESKDTYNSGVALLAANKIMLLDRQLREQGSFVIMIPHDSELSGCDKPGGIVKVKKKKKKDFFMFGAAAGLIVAAAIVLIMSAFGVGVYG